jgi:hypothetical protein
VYVSEQYENQKFRLALKNLATLPFEEASTANGPSASPTAVRWQFYRRQDEKRLRRNSAYTEQPLTQKMIILHTFERKVNKGQMYERKLEPEN